MSYDKVLQAKRYVVGTKQSVKALKLGNVTEILVAKNADPILIGQVIQTAKDVNVPVNFVSSKEELGKVCNIEVSAAAVAIIN